MHIIFPFLLAEIFSKIRKSKHISHSMEDQKLPKSKIDKEKNYSKNYLINYPISLKKSVSICICINVSSYYFNNYCIFKLYLSTYIFNWIHTVYSLQIPLIIYFPTCASCIFASLCKYRHCHSCVTGSTSCLLVIQYQSAQIAYALLPSTISTAVGPRGLTQEQH